VRRKIPLLVLAALALSGCGGRGGGAELETAAEAAPEAAPDTAPLAGDHVGLAAAEAPATTEPPPTAEAEPEQTVTLSDARAFCDRISVFMITWQSIAPGATPDELSELQGAVAQLGDDAAPFLSSSEVEIVNTVGGCLQRLDTLAVPGPADY
jgi:hypothetical protein